MSIDLLHILACCCGPGECCPCHPAFGGATSYDIEWTGSVTASPAEDPCPCLLATVGPFSGGGVLVSSLTLSGDGFISTWNNEANPLICTMTGHSKFSDYGEEYSYLTSDTGCYPNPFAPGTFPSGRLSVNITVTPPQNPCPDTSGFPSVPTGWRVRVVISGVATLTFGSDSMSCDPPGELDLLDVEEFCTGCCDGVGLGLPPAILSYSAGSVFIT